MFDSVNRRWVARGTATFAGALALVAGCTENGPAAARPDAPVPPPLVDEPIGVQVVRKTPRLVGVPFRVLLDFEKPLDLRFITAATPPAASRNGAHTGRGALALNPGTAGVRLSSLISDPFPGRWTIAGAYFKSDEPASITLAWRTDAGAEPAGRRTVALQPGVWTPVFIDLTTAPDQALPPAANRAAGALPLLSTSAAAGQLVLTVAGGAVLCDDVILIDNAVTYTDPPAAGTAPAGMGSVTPATWTIRRRGFHTIVDQPNRFKLTLKTPEAAGAEGWDCREASALRARFVSPGGKTWTVYADGRFVRDGELDLLFKSADPALRKSLAAQHAEPGDLFVAEEFGRVDRETEGDRHNSGYNAVRAAYQLSSARPTRFEFKLTPSAAAAVVRPVFEIGGLTKGSALILVNGQLVDRYAWIGGGRLLFELPITLDRATVINVSVK